MDAIASKEHLHIHWSGTELVDWQRFDLYADAETAAKELVRPYETYVIETFNNDTCERRRSIVAKRSSYVERFYVKSSRRKPREREADRTGD